MSAQPQIDSTVVTACDRLQDGPSGAAAGYMDHPTTLPLDGRPGLAEKTKTAGRALGDEAEEAASETKLASSLARVKVPGMLPVPLRCPDLGSAGSGFGSKGGLATVICVSGFLSTSGGLTAPWRWET